MELLNEPRELIAHLPQGKRFCGVDLGTKTIGLAISDSNHSIASPLETISRKKFGLDCQELKKVVERENIGAWVMGWPLNMDASEGPRAQATRAFIRNVAGLPDFPQLSVILWDERLSTVAVTRSLIEVDTRRDKRAELVDKLAAAYILQGYLDFNANQ